MQFVYLLQELDFDGKPTGCYKIGQTKRDVEKRKNEYKTGNPRRIRTYHTIKVEYAQPVETKLHQIFISNKVNSGGGDEWFNFDIEEIKYVVEVMNQYSAVPTTGEDKTSEEEHIDDRPSVEDYATYSSYTWEEEILALLFNPLGFFVVIVLTVVAIAGIFSNIQQLGQVNNSPAATQLENKQAVISVPGEGKANLRSAPSVESSVITTVTTGQSVVALELSTDAQWRKVRLPNGTTGWVASNFVQEN